MSHLYKVPLLVLYICVHLNQILVLSEFTNTLIIRMCVWIQQIRWRRVLTKHPISTVPVAVFSIFLSTCAFWSDDEILATITLQIEFSQYAPEVHKSSGPMQDLSAKPTHWEYTVSNLEIAGSHSQILSTHFRGKKALFIHSISCEESLFLGHADICIIFVVVTLCTNTDSGIVFRAFGVSGIRATKCDYEENHQTQ